MKFQTFPLTDDGLKALEEVSGIYIIAHLVMNSTTVLAGLIKPLNEQRDPIAVSSASPITSIPKTI